MARRRKPKPLAVQPGSLASVLLATGRQFRRREWPSARVALCRPDGKLRLVRPVGVGLILTREDVLATDWESVDIYT